MYCSLLEVNLSNILETVTSYALKLGCFIFFLQCAKRFIDFKCLLYIVLKLWFYGQVSDYVFKKIITFEKPVQGNRSKLRMDSSPEQPFSWPEYILAAVTVGTDMPSPRKKITFLAGDLMTLRPSWACRYWRASVCQYSAPVGGCTIPVTALDNDVSCLFSLQDILGVET